MICQACGAKIEGTDARFCPKCGGTLPPGPAESKDEMVHSTDSPAISQPPRPPSPTDQPPSDKEWKPSWENRRKVGFITAILETIEQVLFHPANTFREMKQEGGLSTPLLYAVLLLSISGIISLFWNLLFHSLGVFAEEMELAEFALTTGWMVVIMVTMPLWVTAELFFDTAILHLGLWIIGAARRPFETTFRVNSYVKASFAPLFFVPACGPLIAWFWSLGTKIIGIRAAHGITTGKAALAVLLPIIVCCGCGLLIAMSTLGLGISSIIMGG